MENLQGLVVNFKEADAYYHDRGEILVRTNVYKYIRTRIMYTYVYIYMYVYIYIYTYIYMYLCVYM